jgi:predicted enzyme related to lactoylglutathione lyase
MATMRFNHMELTFPRGTLTTELREEIDAFYGSVFGWTGVDAEVVGQMCHILLSEEAQQFILLAESDKPMQSPGYDHLGLLFATREEVDEKLEQVKRYQEKDDRVRIKEYDDLVTGDITTRAFYVKYLLPIFFDVQALERGGEPIGNALT